VVLVTTMQVLHHRYAPLFRGTPCARVSAPYRQSVQKKRREFMPSVAPDLLLREYLLQFSTG
jgi:hypothetical protein